MKKYTVSLLPLLSLGVCLLLLHSCAPVNLLTQVKKTPRLYSENYNYPRVRAERSEMNTRAWVVWSDRDGNATAAIPGGTLPHTELKFMDPLLVIDQKGDYYKLIRHEESILKNEKLTNRKKAEYCGWLHKDRLLLFNSSLTEVRNGIRLKSLTAIRKAHPVLEAEKYFNADSVVLFSSPSLKEPAGGSLGLNSVVYILKQAENDTRMLIGIRPDIKADEAGSLTTGWIDASLVVPFGQRLALTHAPAVSPVKAFHPVLFAGRTDSTIVFRTLDARQVIDRSDNHIFNVDGQPVSWTESQAIGHRLNRVNVIFAFDLTEKVRAQLPALTSALQHVKTVFEASSNEIDYRFSAILGNRVIPFGNNYTNFCDQVAETAKGIRRSSPRTGSGVLEKAIHVVAKTDPATNLVIHIGEKATGESPLKKIVESFIHYNCRLLSFQVFSGKENEYNSFVLQSTALIEAYAEDARKSKRKIIFYPGRLRSENRFNENDRNVYTLDFSDRSMTQGMVIFPEKNRLAEPGLLIAGIDSLVRQVEQDNLELVADMQRAFSELSGHRSRYDAQFSTRFGIDSTLRVSPALSEAFPDTSPQWVEVTSRIALPADSVHLSDLALLLVQEEQDELVEFIGSLSSMPLEKKGELSVDRSTVRNVKEVRKKLKGVLPDAGLDVVFSTEADTLAQADYVRTGKVRKHIKQIYLKALKKCVVEGNPHKLTLAQAQELITTAPTIHPELGRLQIDDLCNKKKITDAQLDRLVQYFEEKKTEIEKTARPVGELNTPGGIKYVLLPVRSLP